MPGLTLISAKCTQKQHTRSLEFWGVISFKLNLGLDEVETVHMAKLGIMVSKLRSLTGH